MYRSIFIDLDDTVWAFTENARDTFQDMYDKYHFDRYFRSFSHFYTLYSGKNEELWNEYGAGRITKDELNEQRFAYPLLQVGVADKALVKAYSDNFFDDIVYKKKLMPHAREALEYLASAYNLYILSNGFRELQEQKMRSAGVEGYFKKIVLSEDIGVHKPFPEIFYFERKMLFKGCPHTQEHPLKTNIGHSLCKYIVCANRLIHQHLPFNFIRKKRFPANPSYQNQV